MFDPFRTIAIPNKKNPFFKFSYFLEAWVIIYTLFKAIKSGNQAGYNTSLTMFNFIWVKINFYKDQLGKVFFIYYRLNPTSPAFKVFLAKN